MKYARKALPWLLGLYAATSLLTSLTTPSTVIAAALVLVSLCALVFRGDGSPVRDTHE